MCNKFDFGEVFASLYRFCPCSFFCSVWTRGNASVVELWKPKAWIAALGVVFCSLYVVGSTLDSHVLGRLHQRNTVCQGH